MEREQFILYSTDVPLTPYIFEFEGDAQRTAEQIARVSRGAKIYIAKLVASVTEPLPALQWSDDRSSGDGRASREVMGLNTVGASPHNAQKSSR